MLTGADAEAALTSVCGITRRAASMRNPIHVRIPSGYLAPVRCSVSSLSSKTKPMARRRRHADGRRGRRSEFDAAPDEVREVPPDYPLIDEFIGTHRLHEVLKDPFEFFVQHELDMVAERLREQGRGEEERRRRLEEERAALDATFHVRVSSWVRHLLATVPVERERQLHKVFKNRDVREISFCKLLSQQGAFAIVEELDKFRRSRDGLATRSRGALYVAASRGRHRLSRISPSLARGLTIAFGWIAIPPKAKAAVSSLGGRALFLVGGIAALLLAIGLLDFLRSP